MRHRLRSVVWRELPYSARRSIIGVVRAIDGVEAYLLRLWGSLFYSPAWLFVAAAGGVGIVLTILLFLMISQELLAGNSANSIRRPIIEPLTAVVSNPWQLDSRLCIDDVRPRVEPYPADFGFDGRVMLAREAQPQPEIETFSGINFDNPPVRRPPSRRPSRSLDAPPEVVDTPATEFDFPRREFVEPASVPAIEAPMGYADLVWNIELWRQEMAPTNSSDPVKILTARSVQPAVGPVDLFPRRNWEEQDRWTWFRGRNSLTPDPNEYAGDRLISMETPAEELWDDISAWPSRTEVGMRVELYAPETASAHRPGYSRLVVENLGLEPIRRIEIQEPVRYLDRVTAAEPPASLEEGVLYRELRRLDTGRRKTLELSWTPRTTGDRHHEARVMAEAYVAASVLVTRPTERIAVEPEPQPAPRIERRLPDPVPEPMIREPAPRPVPVPVEAPPIDFGPPPAAQRAPVKPPSLACRIVSRENVSLQGIAELEIQVTNDGDSKLTAVKIWADLPEGLRHTYGSELQYPVGDLSPGQVHRTVLRVVGEKLGISRVRVVAVATEATSHDSNALVAVSRPTPQRSSRPAARSNCQCDCLQQVSWQAVEF